MEFNSSSPFCPISFYFEPDPLNRIKRKLIPEKESSKFGSTGVEQKKRKLQKHILSNIENEPRICQVFQRCIGKLIEKNRGVERPKRIGYRRITGLLKHEENYTVSESLIYSHATKPKASCKKCSEIYQEYTKKMPAWSHTKKSVKKSTEQEKANTHFSFNFSNFNELTHPLKESEQEKTKINTLETTENFFSFNFSSSNELINPGEKNDSCHHLLVEENFNEKRNLQTSNENNLEDPWNNLLAEENLNEQLTNPQNSNKNTFEENDPWNDLLSEGTFYEHLTIQNLNKNTLEENDPWTNLVQEFNN